MQERKAAFKGWTLNSGLLICLPVPHTPCSPLLYSSPLEDTCFGGIYKKLF